MVYINSTSGTITIPKHSDTSGTYTMVLTSQMSTTVTLVQDGSDISTNSLYYKFALGTLDFLNVGEYTYTLKESDSDDILETGLLTYGEYNREVIVNNNTQKQIIQFNG